jgi:hypothetical protein
MRRVAIVMVALLSVAAFVICGKAFAQEDVSDTQEPVKTVETAETTETAESTESTEATIPYSAPYNSPNTGADQVNVDEDS